MNDEHNEQRPIAQGPAGAAGTDPYELPALNSEVELRFNLPEHDLKAGEVGIVVEIYSSPIKTVKVEFAFRPEFKESKVLLLTPAQIQPVRSLISQRYLESAPLPPVPTKAKKPKRETKADRIQNAAQAVLDAVEEARSKAAEALEAYNEAVEELGTAVEEVEAKLEDLRSVREDEYQGWSDNLPEGLQQSPVGEKLTALLEIDLDLSMPEVPELEELDFSDIENAAQEILDADLPLGFGRD